MTIISLRSTNGGGKSTIVCGLIAGAEKVVPIYGVLGPKSPEAYQLSLKGVSKPTYILGPYITPVGGCDRLIPYDLILDLLAKYAPKGHVVFEGVIVSSSYGRVGRFMEGYGQEAVMAFLDTSLEQCIENVKKRRMAKGDEREFNPKNLTSKYQQIQGSKPKMIAEGKVRVVIIEYEQGLYQVRKLLEEA